MIPAHPLKYLAAVVCAICFASCSDGTTAPGDPLLSGPTNLRAYASDSAIGLQWNASSSEALSNFDKYTFRVLNKATGGVTTISAPKGTTRLLVKPLNNGDRYQFTMHAVSTSGKKSVDSTVVEWSPAFRVTKDINGLPIRIFSTVSTFPCAVDLFADTARAEVLDDSSPDFALRGDFYVYSPSFSGIVELISPHLAGANPGPVTMFSTVPFIETNSLDDMPATSSPASATYTASNIVLDAPYVTKSRVYFGRTQRGTAWYYFRLLVKRSDDGRLVQGFGFDRYIEIEASYQQTRNVPFAKRSK